MILHCSFEELRALASGAELFLTEDESRVQGYVVAPSEAMTDVEQLQPRLTQSLSINTLAEQRTVRKAVAAICDELHERLEEKVLQHHPAHEEAVALYFDYAYAFGVLNRLDEIGAEMTALIEVMNGSVSDQAAGAVEFPD
ncbi:MAG: hypothetical protein KY464_10920 [Gemmatimonadetes bacterium]|nr:hypothetical protein [Gemmatimonadota bacterium]